MNIFIEILNRQDQPTASDDTLREQLKNEFKVFEKRFTNGYKTLLNVIADEQKKNPMSSSTLAYLPSHEKLLALKNKDKVNQYLQEGQGLAQILGLEKDRMPHFFDIACNLLEKEDYEQAGDAFLCLTTLCPRVSIFWQGLARAEV